MDLSPVYGRLGQRATPVAALKRFARTRRVGAEVREYCELCRAPMASEHRQILDIAAHTILCACDTCALSCEVQLDGRYRLIPRDVRALLDFHLDDAQWDDLALPIDLAFILHSSTAGRVIALHPSPSGAIESHLMLSAWEILVADNPVLCDMRPDVEALLINRAGPRRLYYMAPIDVCFQLVALMRRHGCGLSSGEEVWREIDGFFAHLAQAARYDRPPIADVDVPISVPARETSEVPV
jgi:hypothetical protein